MLQVRLVNVALVRDATYRASDLTVVMGPNNSGKSTVATVLYAAVKAAASFRGRGGSPVTRTAQASRRISSLRGRPVIDFSSYLEDVDRKSDARMLENAWSEALNQNTPAILEAYGFQVVSELEQALGARLVDIASHDVSSGRRLPLKIVIETADWAVTIRLRGEDSSVWPQVFRPMEFRLDEMQYFLIRELVRDRESLNAGYFGTEILNAAGTTLFRDFPPGAHYLPAARAGLLQSHRLVAAAMFRQSPLVGIGEVSMPSLSGVVADFVSEILLNRPGRRGPYAGVARKIERQVLSGRVRQVSGETGYPEIEFTDAHGKYPVHRTSSMVSELAPIVLLLQAAVQQHDLLIIEEPESHLHPGTQVHLARILFELAQHGAQIFLTTHSDFFVSALNNLLRERVVDSDASKAPHTNAFWMKRREEGSWLQEIDIDPIDGIADDSFAEVAGNLYDTQVAQQMTLLDR